MATSGYYSNYFSNAKGVSSSIEWKQFNFDPQNESFDISYDIKICFIPLTTIYNARNFTLTFKYTYENKTVIVINNRKLNVPSGSFNSITVASGNITIKTSELSNLNRIWEVECIVSFQSGIMDYLSGNYTWGDYETNKLIHSFTLDGFLSPNILESKIQEILFFNDTCNTMTFNVVEAYKQLKYDIIVNFKNFTETIKNYEFIDGEIRYTPPISWLNLMPNIIETYATVTIIAYNNNRKQIGNKNINNFKVKIDDSVIPSIGNLLLEKISDVVPDEWDLLIQGNSQAKITMQNILPGKGAEIKEYHIYDNIGNISLDTYLTTDILLKPGTLEFNAYVIDSRNRKSNIKTFYVNVEPYHYPSIIEYYAKRCNSNMELIDNGENILAKMNASYSFCNYKNTITELSVNVKKSINDELVSIDSITLNNEMLLNGIYDPEYSYLVTFSISDCLHTSKISLLVSTSNATIDLKRGGTGIAFGKVSEIDGFECEFDAYFNNNIYLTIDGIQKEIRNLIKEMDTQKIAFDKLVKSTEITEDGYIIDGKYLSNILFEMNNLIINKEYIIEFGEGTILTESHKTPSNITISTGNTTINLNKQFTSTPYIFLTNNNMSSTINAYGITLNSFNVFGNYELTSQNGTINFNWLAIQKV